MSRAFASGCAVLLLGLAAASPALGQGKPGEANTIGADFPPGAFTDGQNWSLTDLRGKVVVVFFLEPT